MRIKETLVVLSFAFVGMSASLSRADSCGPEQYFAPQDNNNEFPLKAAHPDLRKTRELAVRGIAAEQRNLAAFYESGYLVSACRDKAVYWYGKAARSGDAVAKTWMERHASMEDIRNRRECFGDVCLASASNGIQKTVLQTDAGGAYTALVSINGRTVRGIVDTGATYVSMSARTAGELGIQYSNGKQLRMTTANGTKLARAVMLSSVSVGNITLNQVEAVVGDADHPLLIGMSFLSRLTISTHGGGMTLVKP